MKKVQRVDSSDHRFFMEVIENVDGTFSLQRFARKHDPEEQVDYVIRDLPDPIGRFSNLDAAVNEAQRSLG